MISGDIMNDKKIIDMLKEVSRRKRIQYIKNEVKARLLKKRLVESLKSSKTLLEQVAQPPSASDRSYAPGDLGGRHSKVSSASFADFPTPDDLEDQILRLVDEDAISPSDSLAVFGTGNGKGTYRQLIADFKKASAGSQDSKEMSMSIDNIVKSMLEPGKSEEDLKKLRSAAARLLRGAAGSGKKKQG